MNGRLVHTTAVCVSLRWLECLHVVRLPAESWHRLPRWKHGLRMRCVVPYGSASFPWLVFFFAALLWGPMMHRHEGNGCDKGAHQPHLWIERNASVVPNWFQPRQSCCHLCYAWEYLMLANLVRYNWAPVLETCDCLKLLSVYFDLLVHVAGVVCHQLRLLNTDLHAVGCGGFVETLN